MLNKVLVKVHYFLQLTDNALLVISPSNGKVKARIALCQLHAKLAPKQLRSPSEVTDLLSDTPRLEWYPLKLVMVSKKSRTIYFESPQQCQEVLQAILIAQGFQSQLDQYEIEHEIQEQGSNPVAIGSHRITGTKVVLKAIDQAKYNRLA